MKEQYVVKRKYVVKRTICCYFTTKNNIRDGAGSKWPPVPKV